MPRLQWRFVQRFNSVNTNSISDVRRPDGDVGMAAAQLSKVGMTLLIHTPGLTDIHTVCAYKYLGVLSCYVGPSTRGIKIGRINGLGFC